MRPALHPAVHEHFDPITYGVDDFGQLVERCPRAVKLSAAMVGNNDAGTTDLGSVFGVGWGHDALQAELTVPLPHHLGHIVPVHRWVEHPREIIADRECAAAHINVLLELRQSKPLVSDVVDAPPRLHCKLHHPSERQPERYGKACAKIAFAVPTRDAVSNPLSSSKESATNLTGKIEPALARNRRFESVSLRHLPTQKENLAGGVAGDAPHVTAKFRAQHSA